MKIISSFVPSPTQLYQHGLSYHHKSRIQTTRRKAVMTTSSTRIETPDGNGLNAVIHNTESNTHSRHAVLIHDFMTDNRLFNQLIKQDDLCACKMIAIDLRGFGESPEPTNQYSRADDIELARKAIQNEKHRAHIIGSGMGGIEALEYSLAYPDQVASLTLINSSLVGHRWSSERVFLNITQAQEVGRILRKELKYPSMKIDEDSWNVLKWKKDFISVNETWNHILGYDDKTTGRKLLQMAKDYGGYHFFHDDPQVNGPFDGSPLRIRLEHISVPTLVMVGENDTEDFRNIADELHKGLSNAYESGPYVIEDCGHFAVLEKPKAVATKLKEFWDFVDN